MASRPQSVLVFGATGNTGSSIMNGLLAYGKAKVIAVVRESSVSKPAVQAYKSKGVDIRVFDLDLKFTTEDTVKLFEGIDVVIAAFQVTHAHLQYNLIDAAKMAGVKRFVPCDFASPSVKGVRVLHDMKLAVREYLQASGVGYTFIDVGWWAQMLLPLHKPELSPFPAWPQYAEWCKEKFGSYKTRNAVTALEDVGHFVARIVEDPRTLGKYVFCWGDEVNQATVIEIVEELSPVEVEFKHISEEDLWNCLQRSRADKDQFIAIRLEYMYSIWVREDNLVEKAKLPEYGGALDARELYPDLKPKTFRQVADEFYRQ